MQQHLCTVQLKSGEPMTLVKVTAPAPEWQDRIVPFLQHKGDPWVWQVKNALADGLPGAAQHFFEGLLEDGTLVGNITTVECHAPPIGLLQHVFTAPEHRRKGVCNALMAAVCDDFRARGGRVMYLHTGYDGPAYHVYASFGFVGHENTGAMAWTLDQGFRHDYYMPAEATVHDTDWGDWVSLEALSWTVGGWQMRSFYLPKYGFGGFEGDYLRLRRDMEQGRVHQFKVLRTESGTVAGYAFLATFFHWPGWPLALDLFVHPHFYRDAEKLVAAVEIPDHAQVLAFSDSAAVAKDAALESIGLTRTGVVAGLLTSPEGEALDLLIFSLAP